MGRRNERGLQLSFKPAKGSRGRGRWFKKIDGRASYFGWGEGVSDRASYRIALAAYEKWRALRAAAASISERSAHTRALQYDLSALDYDPGRVSLDDARRHIDRLSQLGGATTAAPFVRAVDSEDKRRLLAKLEELDLAELRAALGDAPRQAAGRRTLGDVLDEFLAAQRQRMERRRKSEELRAQGKDIKEARKENMSPGRFARLATAVKAFRECAGNRAWDGTEEAAANIVGQFRSASAERHLEGKLAAASFNENMQCARQFCGWAEKCYKLERVPRNGQLFAKYPLTRSARAIPLDKLRKLWDVADDRGRCFILLALNCGYYARDISNLTAEMIEGRYLAHTRSKTDVNIRYRLWPKTLECLRKVMPESGTVFRTGRGTALVRHEMSAKSGNPVCVDNVKLWFVRLCADAGVKTGKGGYSFSNLRDTAASEVERIDRNLTDLFLAHVDRRMAAFYVDGKMIDSTPLDAVLKQLESHFRATWSRTSRRRSAGATA